MSTPRANGDENNALRAVIFDLGGVVLGSPLHAIADYERELGLPEHFVNRVVMQTAPSGAWSRLERGELDLETFFPAFEADCKEAGECIDARVMFARMGAASQPRPQMLEAIQKIRTQGLRVAALTNNWATEEPQDSGTALLRDRFDVFIESSVEGLRKPDPKIYELACHRLQIAPNHCAFLDDIGANLKPAKAMGMTTIRVKDPNQALTELQTALGFQLA